LLAGEDVAYDRGVSVVMVIEDGVEVVEVGLRGVGGELALEPLADGACLASCAELVTGGCPQSGKRRKVGLRREPRLGGVHGLQCSGHQLISSMTPADVPRNA
jgi:hypothetical protein